MSRDASTSSTPSTQSSSTGLLGREATRLPSPEERKGQLLERIERQRLLRQTRRIQAVIATLQAEGPASASGDRAGDGFPRSQLMRTLTRQPLLVAAAAGVFLLMGPRRVVGLASWALPMLMRRLG